MPISLPYVFADGQVAEATYVNANFNALANGALPLAGGALTGPVSSSANISTTGQFSAGTLIATGATTLNGGLTLPAASNINCGGVLQVTGTTTLAGTTVASLTNNGNETIAGTLNVTGQVTLSSGLNATGVVSTGADMYAANLHCSQYGVLYNSINGSNFLGFGWTGAQLQLYVNGNSTALFNAASSDIRFKREVREVLSDALAALTRLPMHSYVAGDPEVTYRVGLIADFVRRVIPEAVIVGPDHQGTPLLSLDLNVLVAYCVGAIQQLARRLERLEREERG